MPITLIPNERFGPSGADFAAAEQSTDNRATRASRIALTNAKARGLDVSTEAAREELDFTRDTRDVRRERYQSAADLDKLNVDIAKSKRKAADREEARAASFRVENEATHDYIMKRAMNDPGFDVNNPDHAAMIENVSNAREAFIDSGSLGVFNPRMRPWIEEQIAVYDPDMAVRVQQRAAFEKELEKAERAQAIETLRKQTEVAQMLVDLSQDLSGVPGPGGGGGGHRTTKIVNDLLAQQADARRDFAEKSGRVQILENDLASREANYADLSDRFYLAGDELDAKNDLEDARQELEMARLEASAAGDLADSFAPQISKAQAMVEGRANLGWLRAQGLDELLDESGVGSLIPYVDSPNIPPATPDQGEPAGNPSPESPNPSPIEPQPPASPEVVQATIHKLNGLLQTGETYLPGSLINAAYTTLNELGIPTTLGGLGAAMNSPPLNALSHDDLTTLNAVVLHLAEGRPIVPGTIGEEPGRGAPRGPLEAHRVLDEMMP